MSLIPIVSGDGPLDAPKMLAVRNSRLPTLSALEIDAGLVRPLAANTLSLLNLSGLNFWITLQI